MYTSQHIKVLEHYLTSIQIFTDNVHIKCVHYHHLLHYNSSRVLASMKCINTTDI